MQLTNISIVTLDNLARFYTKDMENLRSST